MFTLLFVGDVVGQEAAEYLARRLPALTAEHNIDLVIVNAENANVSRPQIRPGFGMTHRIVQLLFDAGANVITSGNHAWDGDEAESVLQVPNVLRPHNMPDGLPGCGYTAVDVHGEPVTVVNLISRSAVPEPEPVYWRYLPPGAPRDVQPLWRAWTAIPRTGTVVIDFHGLVVSEKQAFAHAVDGQASAVLGTHTHEATHLLHVLEHGTALVTDVGMTGRLGGVTGIDPAHWIAMLQGNDPAQLPPYTLATGPMTLGAVVLTIDGGRTRSIRRLA